MSENPPYMQSFSNITKGLNRIQDAATPARFTQDFLETTLAMKGGSARPLIPFLKRTGFIGSDGVPTDLYKQFRNPAQQGAAAREALRNGYSSLYEVNEYVHDTSDADLKGIVVQVTGLNKNDRTVKAITESFKALKEFAVFDEEDVHEGVDEPAEISEHASQPTDGLTRADHAPRLGLSYTINLNLPSTSDIAVFDAIFKSLKEHLLK